MDFEYDYENDVKINPDALDVEWLEQPALYMRYGELAVHARKKVAKAEERLKVIRSELVEECKTDNPKATAPQIEAYYRTHERHKEAKQILIEAEAERDMLDIALYAIQMRRSALENLVKLSAQNYFAGPTEPRDLGLEYDKTVKQKAAKEKAQSRLNENTEPRKSRRTR